MITKAQYGEYFIAPHTFPDHRTFFFLISLFRKPVRFFSFLPPADSKLNLK